MAFVKEQQAVTKEEKAQKCVEKQAVCDEWACKEEVEREERTRKAECMKEEMRMKIELARIQLEIEPATPARITPDTGDVQVMANKPKLPTFDEKHDERTLRDLNTSLRVNYGTERTWRLVSAPF